MARMWLRETDRDMEKAALDTSWLDQVLSVDEAQALRVTRQSVCDRLHY